MVNETVLSHMVKDFGDYVMRVVMEDLYGSGIAHLLVLVGATIAFISLGFSLHRGSSPRRAVIFFIAWICCLPIGGKPFAYAVVNGIGTALAYQLQKTSVKVLEGTASSHTMPPGWVINSILRASGVGISDETLQADLNVLLGSCIPNVANMEGEPMTAADLFSGTKRANQAGRESYEERFDPQPLRERQILIHDRTASCYDLLLDVRSRLRQHIEAKQVTRTDTANYLAVSSGDITDPSKLKTTWPEPNSSESQRVKAVALNLATASAVQKAAMGITGEAEHFWQSRGNFVDRRVVRSTDPTIARHFESGEDGAGNWLTRATFDLMSAPTAIARALNIDGAIKSGMVLQELNEKLLSLPYYITFVQSILKILAPLAVLSILVGTFKLFFMWSSIWWLTLIMPAVMQLSRGISNAILFHTNKIGDTAKLLQSEPGFLAQAVSFEAASKLVDDSSRMMSVILNVELGIWVALLALIPTGAWFAGSIANRLSASIADSLVSGIIRGGTIKMGGALAAKGEAAWSAMGKAGSTIATATMSHARQVVSLAPDRNAANDWVGNSGNFGRSKPNTKDKM